MNKVAFLKNIALFAELSEQQLNRIAQDTMTRRYKQGEVIFREGDPGQVLYIIQSGQIRIFVNGMDGSETSVILFGRPGELFGELSIIDGLPRSATAVALEPTVLLILGRESFRRHMRQMPQLAMNFMQVLSKRVRYNTQQIDGFASLTITQRLARKLLELAHDYGRVEETGVFIDMHLTQTTLAGMLGATRERVNRCLSDFRKSEWITTSQGYITVLDPEALRTAVSG
ncbi:MAG: Crp/Fnr family transcriptional regulator [Chloroflexota bacterium]